MGTKNDLYIDLIGINNKLDFTQGTFNTTTLVTKTSNLGQLTLGGTAAWRTQWNEGHSSEIGFYNSYYNVDAKNAAIEYNQVTTQQNTILDSGIRVSDNRKLNPLFTLHTGYQYNKIGIKNSDRINEPAYRHDVKNVLDTHAIVGELEYSPEDGRLYARAGLRANYMEQFALLYAEPRLQVNYTLAENWQLEVLAEKKSQSASQVVELQDDFLGIEKRRWVLANNGSIPVQRSNQVSAGISFKNSGWLVTLDNFYKKVKGITTAGQAFQDQLELVQATGSYTVYGTEFLIQKQFQDFYVWLSYTWNHNNYSFNGVEPQHFPSSFELSHTINTAAIYEWNNLKIALGSKWFTGRPVTLPLLNEPTYTSAGTPVIAYSYPNSHNIGNFLQINFSAAYSWQLVQKVRFQFGLSVLNVFNRKNIINRYYRMSTSGTDIEMVNTYALERTPNAFVKLSF